MWLSNCHILFLGNGNMGWFYIFTALFFAFLDIINKLIWYIVNCCNLGYYDVLTLKKWQFFIWLSMENMTYGCYVSHISILIFRLLDVWFSEWCSKHFLLCFVFTLQFIVAVPSISSTFYICWVLLRFSLYFNIWNITNIYVVP